MFRCSADRQELAFKETWASAALCDPLAGVCKMPVCTPGAVRCNGDNLETCDTNGLEYTVTRVCDPGQCDAALKICKETPACAAGEHRCMGDILERCSDDRKTFEPYVVCPAGMCDAANRECDECKSGTAECVGATPRACDSTGHWKSLSPCSGSTPLCSAGVCVSGSPTVTFPSTSAITWNMFAGTMTLGPGGGMVHYQAGSYLEDKLARTTPVSKIEFKFKMYDGTTTTVCTPGTLTWAIKLNGVDIGKYSWVGGTSSDKTVTETYSFPPIAPVDGIIKVHIEATTTVCMGGGSWNWYSGGTAAMY